MAEPRSHNLPLPQVLSFLACHDVYRDERTGAVILIGPTSHLPLTQFPTHVRLSVYADFTGGHGRYEARVCLLDGSDDVVWGWTLPKPIEHTEPLLPHQVMFHDLKVAVPRLGRYRLVLLFNGTEVAHRGMWFGPAQAFRSGGPKAPEEGS
jgi:hypothetical protein